MRSMPDTGRVYGCSKGAEMATNWPAKAKAQQYQRNRSAEEGNRTLPSLLKTIGRNVVRTQGSGREAPHDAVTGQRYWPSIGPAPSSASRCGLACDAAMCFTKWLLPRASRRGVA